jgi:hypothetical protein
VCVAAKLHRFKFFSAHARKNCSPKTATKKMLRNWWLVTSQSDLSVLWQFEPSPTRRLSGLMALAQTETPPVSQKETGGVGRLQMC